MVASERAAFSAVAAALVADEAASRDISALRPWSHALRTGDLVADPCVDRMVGLWCERGRLVSVQFGGDRPGLRGALTDDWAAFTSLRHLDLSRAELSGPVPAVLCTLPALGVLMLDSCGGLTSLPECAAAAPRCPWQMLSVASNRVRVLPDWIADLPHLIFVRLARPPARSLARVRARLRPCRRAAGRAGRWNQLIPPPVFVA